MSGFAEQCLYWNFKICDRNLLIWNYPVREIALRKLAHAIYRDFFSPVKIENFMKTILIFFAEAVLTSTHNLCFEAKIRKKVYPRIPQFCYIKVGLKRVYITRTCLPDGLDESRLLQRLSLEQAIKHLNLNHKA